MLDLSGGFAIFQSLTGYFLPQDVSRAAAPLRVYLGAERISE
jgi:hypothetical protein